LVLGVQSQQWSLFSKMLALADGLSTPPGGDSPPFALGHPASLFLSWLLIKEALLRKLAAGCFSFTPSHETWFTSHHKPRGSELSCPFHR
jgi:hypothetical protein